MIGYYDAINDRYLVPDASGTDPKTVWCIVLTRSWNDYLLSFDYSMSDRLLFRRSDLDFYKRETI